MQLWSEANCLIFFLNLTNTKIESELQMEYVYLQRRLKEAIYKEICLKLSSLLLIAKSQDVYV